MLLSLIIFGPLIGAALIACVPRSQEKAHFAIAIATTASVAALCIYLLTQFDYSHSALPQFSAQHSWIPAVNSQYLVWVDGISLPLLAMSILTVFLTSIYCLFYLPEPRNPKAIFLLLLLIETGINGVFLAQDLILFFVFFEVVLLPMYFLVGIWGGANRGYAAMKFFVYTALGSAFLLIGFLCIYFFGPHTFNLHELSTDPTLRSMSHTTQLLIFAALLFGFGVKVPLFPFHTWMPDTHTEAPTIGSVLLAAVLLKLGAYGFIRIALPVLPDAAHSYAPVIGLLAVIGIIYGALGCLAQRDMKRLIAFSSLAHMGFVMLGIATLTAAGISAAIFAMVAHGIITGMLFFLAGSVYQRLHTRDLTNLSGLLNIAPRLAWILGLCAMASFGLPGLAGFWGEFSSILSAFQPASGLPVGTFRVYMVLGAIGTVLAAGYLMWMYQRIAFGQPGESLQGLSVKDVRVAEYLAWIPLLVLIVVLGVFPSLVFGITNNAVETTILLMRAR